MTLEEMYSGTGFEGIYNKLQKTLKENYYEGFDTSSVSVAIIESLNCALEWAK